MSREAIRNLKRALRHRASESGAEGHREAASQAALALLERSVRMRHRRLAVLRLNDAVALGARVPEEHWCYCRQAAEASRDASLRAVVATSERVAREQRAGVTGGARHG